MNKIKQHLRNNKVAYVACGVTAIVVAGVTYYVTRNGDAVKAVTSATTEYVGDVVIHNAPKQVACYKPTLNVLNFVDNSNPSKPVALLGADGGVEKAWNSISAAAKDLGVDKRLLSKAVNNIIDEVNGMKFAPVQAAA